MKLRRNMPGRVGISVGAPSQRTGSTDGRSGGGSGAAGGRAEVEAKAREMKMRPQVPAARAEDVAAAAKYDEMREAHEWDILNAAKNARMQGRIDATEALRIGLIQELVPDAQLLDRARAAAAEHSANSVERRAGTR